MCSTKIARKHFHSQSMGEDALLVMLRVKKKVLIRNRAFSFFMKQIESYFESETYFTMVLRNYYEIIEKLL